MRPRRHPGDPPRRAAGRQLGGRGKPDQLAHDERRLQVRRSDGQWLIGPDAYFFEEGTGEQYEAARYGEFRLQESGKALLVGLRDEQLKPVGNTRARW